MPARYRTGWSGCASIAGLLEGVDVVSKPEFRLAVISDVHADVDALRDALAQIDRLGCERIVCCGDLVDWGRFPNETIALLKERRVECIRGNHDRWAIEKADDGASGGLTPESLEFLRALPTKLDLLLEWTRVAVRTGGNAAI